MNHLFNSPVAVFDMDGVLADLPPFLRAKGSPTLNDPNFWRDYFARAESEPIAQNVKLLSRLIVAGYAIIVLTARYEETRDSAILQLNKYNIAVDGGGYPAPERARVVLLMCGPEDREAFGHDTGAWKASVLRQLLDMDVKVEWMMEDHKSNAEACRRVVPVLLYERMR